MSAFDFLVFFFLSPGDENRTELQVERRNQLFFLDACALHGMCGDFYLKVASGEPTRMTGEQKLAAGLEDACQRVRIDAAEQGNRGSELAEPIYSLAGLLFNNSDFEEARSLYERALDLAEAHFGAEHARTVLYLKTLALVGSIPSNGAATMPVMLSMIWTTREQHPFNVMLGPFAPISTVKILMTLNVF